MHHPLLLPFHLAIVDFSHHPYQIEYVVELHDLFERQVHGTLQIEESQHVGKMYLDELYVPYDLV